MEAQFDQIKKNYALVNHNYHKKIKKVFISEI